jgi:hypothetical protein
MGAAYKQGSVRARVYIRKARSDFLVRDPAALLNTQAIADELRARRQVLLRSGAAAPLVHLGEFPSKVSHHVEGHSENVLPRGDIAGVGCEDISYRATGKSQRPHLQRLSPEHFSGDRLRRELEVLQRNRVRVRRSHRFGSFAQFDLLGRSVVCRP